MARKKPRGLATYRRHHVAGFQVREVTISDVEVAEMKLEVTRENPSRRTLDGEVQEIVERSGVVRANLNRYLEMVQAKHVRKVVFLAYSDIGAIMDNSAEPPPSVPPLGEGLIAFFCARETAEAILGDLEEQFGRYAERWGSDFARRWYWWQVAVISLRFGWRWAQRLTELGVVLRRLIS